MINFFILNTIGILLFYFNNLLFHNFLLGFFAFLAYFFSAAIIASKILKKVFNFPNFFLLPLGFFLNFFIISFLGAISTVLWDFSFLTNTLILVLNSGIIFFFSRIFNKGEIIQQSISVKEDFHPTFILKIIYSLNLIIIFSGLILLLSERTGGFIKSYWEVLSWSYLILIFLAIFLTTILIFSKKFSYQKILTLIIFTVFLVTAPATFVYKLGYGGDKWRHVAIEKHLLENKPVWGSFKIKGQADYKKIGPFKIRSVFLSGNLSYTSLWASTVNLSRFLQIDPFWIDMHLVHLLWSIFVPLIFFLIGQKILGDIVFALFFGLAPLGFYFFQVYGSISVPTSFGFLLFLLPFLFWIYFLYHPDRRIYYLTLFLSLLAIFNYAVPAIFILEILAITPFILNFSQAKIRKQKIFYLGIILCGLLIFFLTILGLDGLYGSATFDFTIIGDIKSFILKIFDWIKSQFFISGFIGITKGQFLIYNGPFLKFQNILILKIGYIFGMIAWLLVFIGIIKIIKAKIHEPAWILILFFFLVTQINYGLNWYLLKGFGPIGNRLDQISLFFLIPFFVIGFYTIYNLLKKLKTAGIFFVLLFFPIFMIYAYTSGPTLNATTENEYKAAKIVNEKIKQKQGICVLADEWQLLPLLTVSSAKIENGGFVSEEEKNQFLNVIYEEPSSENVKKAAAKQKTNYCFVVVEEKFTSKNVIEKLMESATYSTTVGDVYILEFNF